MWARMGREKKRRADDDRSDDHREGEPIARLQQVALDGPAALVANIEQRFAAFEATGEAAKCDRRLIGKFADRHERPVQLRKLRCAGFGPQRARDESAAIRLEGRKRTELRIEPLNEAFQLRERAHQQSSLAQLPDMMPATQPNELVNDGAERMAPRSRGAIVAIER